MKYVRTKDRVCEFEMELSTMPNLIAVKGEGINGFVRREDIVKQADTFEELCDGLIVEQKDNEDKWFTMSVNEFKNMDLEEKQYMVKDWNYYGFIKNDKGLIYVAKMNEEGKLELL